MEKKAWSFLAYGYATCGQEVNLFRFWDLGIRSDLGRIDLETSGSILLELPMHAPDLDDVLLILYLFMCSESMMCFDFLKRK